MEHRTQKCLLPPPPTPHPRIFGEQDNFFFWRFLRTFYQVKDSSLLQVSFNLVQLGKEMVATPDNLSDDHIDQANNRKHSRIYLLVRGKSIQSWKAFNIITNGDKIVCKTVVTYLDQKILKRQREIFEGFVYLFFQQMYPIMKNIDFKIPLFT